jgi:hypothetical protein
MEPCRDCMALEDELFSANGRWVSLVLQQNRMVREGNPAAITLEDAIRRARRRRDAVTRLLTAHLKKHDDLSSTKMRTANV